MCFSQYQLLRRIDNDLNLCETVPSIYIYCTITKIFEPPVILLQSNKVRLRSNTTCSIIIHYAGDIIISETKD